MRAGIELWVALASVLIGGCISGGNNVLGGDRHVTWVDDGTMVTATVGKARWASSAGQDSVDMIGNNDSAGIEIYAAAPTPFVAQTLVCSQTTSGPALLITYRNGDPAGPAFMHQSCTVAFTQIGAVGGAPITGTFEVVFDLPSGGTKSITNGSFDLPLSM